MVLSWEARLVSPQQSNSPGLNLGEFRCFFSSSSLHSDYCTRFGDKKTMLAQDSITKFRFFFLRKHENAFCKPFCDATSIATQSIPSYVVINVHACQRSQKASNKKSTITIPLLCRFVKLRRCLMIMTFLMEASRSKSSAWSLM